MSDNRAKNHPENKAASEALNADYRHSCGRLLFRGHLAAGTELSIRCPRCGMIVVFEVRTLPLPAAGILDSVA